MGLASASVTSSHRLRIGMLAPLSWRVPPRHYGPWELVTSLLTEGLVERGVDVTLFATADSLTNARLVAKCARPYSEDPSCDVKVWECLHIAEAFERAEEFDLIHNHYDFLPLSYSGLVRTPVVTTIHGFSSERVMPVYEQYNNRTYYVAISDAHRDPRLSYIATVHHGIPLEDYRLQRTPGDHLVFWGRIDRDKGAAEAIEVARRMGRRLLMAGIISDREYFAREVEPHIDGRQVCYLGSLGPDRREEVLGRASALLHLINFDEPFGLGIIEAMAYGTPVISIDRGAASEVIRHGTSGFVVDGLDAAIAAVGRLRELDREQVRAHVAANFTRDRMVDGYLRVYEEIGRRHRHPVSEPWEYLAVDLERNARSVVGACGNRRSR